MTRSRDFRLGARGAAAAVLAAALVLLLSGAAARGSHVSVALKDKAAHLALHLSATPGADGVVTTRTPHHEPAPGQRVTPGALSGAPLLVLLASVLLVAAASSRPVPEVARQRLPRRRGPPRDAFSR
jgi:hypothetical protein